MLRTVFLLASLALVSSAIAQSAPQPAMPSDSEIRQILVDRIDVQHQSVGIVVGVIGPEGRRVVAYGQLEKGDPRPLNGDTIFEIGSMTKVFTSLVLADMVQRGEVALDDPVAKYLPASVTNAGARRARRSHWWIWRRTPRACRALPTNFTPKDPANPYADYTVEQLYQFLSSYQLTRDIGSRYEYSNLGGGLLGHVLALRAGMSYEALGAVAHLRSAGDEGHTDHADAGNEGAASRRAQPSARTRRKLGSAHARGLRARCGRPQTIC